MYGSCSVSSSFGHSTQYCCHHYWGYTVSAGQLQRLVFFFRSNQQGQFQFWDFSHRITEYWVGRDWKDDLVQPFLAKAQSRQNGPALSSHILKVFNAGDSTASLAGLSQWLIVLIVKFALVFMRMASGTWARCLSCDAGLITDAYNSWFLRSSSNLLCSAFASCWYKASDLLRTQIHTRI